MISSRNIHLISTYRYVLYNVINYQTLQNYQGYTFIKIHNYYCITIIITNEDYNNIGNFIPLVVCTYIMINEMYKIIQRRDEYCIINYYR